LDSFVCIDLETTGLDYAYDKIIEIGAVKYIKGEKAGEFSQLINPGVSITPDITQLTGISNDDVAGSPSMDEVIPRFEQFLEDTPLFVGHNIYFDVSFIKRHLSDKYSAIIDSSTADTAALARLVWPGQKSYSLFNLSEFIGIKEPPTHRALKDADVTAQLYLREITTLAHLPKNMQNLVAGLLFGMHLKGAVFSSLESIARRFPQSSTYAYDYGDNIFGSGEINHVAEYVEIHPDKITDYFDTSLRQSITEYEERPQQIEMAIQVAGAFNRSEIFLAEAPTGVGKSLAYLIPAIIWAKTNGESVIISTGTKNLQDQLFNKDIPQVAQALKLDFKAVLLKGRANYLCLFKYYELLNEAISSFGQEERQALLSLAVWAETTRTGDISECTGFSITRWRYLWARASCEGNFCLGKVCNHYKRCFLYKAKNEAASAHIKVINHHLLFADYSSRGDLLATSGHAIIDEAHNLEKVAASYLGPEISFSQFLTLFNQIFTVRPVETGFLALAKMRALTVDREEAKRINNEISKIQRKLMAARGDSNEFFDKLTSAVVSGTNEETRSREISYNDITRFVSQLVIDKFNKSLKELENTLIDLSELIEESDSLKDRLELSVRAKALSQDLRDCRQAYEFLTVSDSQDFVYWIEISRKTDARIVSAPLEVGKILDSGFYDRLKTLILCSATLSVAGDFSYYKKRLGLNLNSADRTFEKALDSPFNLKRNIGFYSAGFLPNPNAANFDKECAEVIYDLFATVKVKGMVLFTAYKNIVSVVDSVGGRLLDSGFELFVQDGSQSPARLLSRFRNSTSGILFGTDSFWEGVDLPGDELQLLVIVKLPFAVPDKPWIKANLDRIDSRGGTSFMEFSLPEAVIKFRQGFGRLIRKKTDSGCVVVLDSRLSGKEYGKYFIKSVPPTLFTAANHNELTVAVKQFFEFSRQ
jgi:predicted DnaQ family exonuclease/DinG family helicase